MAIKWSDTYATGIVIVDEQHQGLFRAVDQLLNACSEGKGKQEVDKIMEFLSEYVIKHFSTEEELQQRYDYPGFQRHKKLHDDFISAFGDLKRRFEAEGPTLSFVTNINKTVVEWLIKHIGQVDLKMGAYLLEKMKG